MEYILVGSFLTGMALGLVLLCIYAAAYLASIFGFGAYRVVRFILKHGHHWETWVITLGAMIACFRIFEYIYPL